MTSTKIVSIAIYKHIASFKVFFQELLIASIQIYDGTTKLKYTTGILFKHNFLLYIYMCVCVCVCVSSSYKNFSCICKSYMGSQRRWEFGEFVEVKELC